MVIQWEKLKKKAMSSDICKLEEDINNIEFNLLYDPGSVVLQGELKSCLTSRSKLLLHKEETLRQQSRATWLLAWDENTRYFHQFSNKRRVNNSIWEAMEVNNTTVYDQVSIKKVVENFFADLYK